MRVGYIECFAGISGDMLLGALVDAGVSRKLLEETVAALGIGAELRFTSVSRSGIQATKVDVLVDGKPAELAAAGHSHEHSHSHDHSHEHLHPVEHKHEPHAHDHTHSHDHKHDHDQAHTHGRSWREIRELLLHVALPEDARSLALRAFELLAHAEARIHNTPVETVHFHEVGAVDTIVDIVCGAAGLLSLGIDRWVCSPVNTGSGFVECAHGKFPVPAPATAELLKGVPIYAAGPAVEMVTPTGAAMLRALGCSFGDPGTITVSSIGYGAGNRNPDRFPNVLRLSIGEAAAASRTPFKTDRVTVIECALDDTTSQLVAHTMELAMKQGALDVMCAPVLMKKGRMGSLLTILSRPQDAAAMQALLLRETTTLGVRSREEERAVLERSFVAVETPYGPIRIKLGISADEVWNAMPEYEDCAQAAAQHHVALKQVMQSALAAFAETKAEA